MCKVVRVFNQTFIKETKKGGKETFKFSRIMKTKPSQHFRLKVLNVAIVNVEPKHKHFLTHLFLSGIPTINMNSNTQWVDSSRVKENNKFYLGSIDCDGLIGSVGGEMLLDEIPLDPFVIECEHSVEDIDFLVCFQIELLE